MFSVRIKVRFQILQPVCPACGSVRIRRQHSVYSNPEWWNRARLLLLQVSFACDKCEHTFFDFFFQEWRARSLRSSRRMEIRNEASSIQLD